MPKSQCDQCKTIFNGIVWRSRGSTFCSSACYDKAKGVTNRTFDWSGYRQKEAVFESYYDHAMGKWCTSYSQQENSLKEYNRTQRETTAYPRELSFIQDDKKFMKECVDLSRNKRDYVKERYEKSGRDRAMLTPTHKQWIDGTKKRVYFTSLAIMLMCATAFARLDGIDWVQVTVHDKVYDLPIYNSDVKNDVYLIKRAIDGNDVIAREIILAGADKKAIFIGDGDVIRWLYITPDDQWVEEIGG